MNPHLNGRARSSIRSRLISIIVAVALGCSISVVGRPTTAAAEVVATCQSKRENPHQSKHFPLTINAIGRVLWCKGKPIPDLHLDVRIVRWTGDHWTTVTTKRKTLAPKRDLLRVSRSTFRCIPGYYATESRVFGFGKHNPWKRGKVVLLECGSGGGRGGGGGGGW